MDKLKATFANYENYLAFVQEKLNKFFKAQSPFIACKEGCAHCCKNAQFPYSQMEFNYLIYGSLSIDKEIQSQIEKNIEKVLKDKKEFQGEKFRYDCPFLINNSCSVYQHRGLICRAFGLLEICHQDKLKIPFCHELGLNYANVVDNDKKIISEEKYKALNVEEQPLSYNVGYNFLTSEEIENSFNFKFGEKKSLIDWLEE